MKTLHVSTRKAWREWLAKHHDKEKEIWLVYYRKHTGKPRISYNDAVEEALCYGWIDSIQRGIDEERFAQRFSPRRKGSPWSEANKERLRQLIEAGEMTPAGLAAAEKALEDDRFVIAPDILKALKQDQKAWQNFQRFPEPYKRIRIGFIEGARNRPEEFRRRL
jgi:uncharacterized protein YdeI (YjbR/CyaY-like superfamily)